MQDYLELYNQMISREVYWCAFYDEDNELTESCGGLVGDDGIRSYLEEQMDIGEGIIISGDGAGLLSNIRGFSVDGGKLRREAMNAREVLGV